MLYRMVAKSTAVMRLLSLLLLFRRFCSWHPCPHCSGTGESEGGGQQGDHHPHRSRR
jgi:hypothetical protein